MSVLLFFFIIIQNINNVCSIGLIINSTCVPLESASYHPDTSKQSHQIGWLKVISCNESIGRANTNTFTINRANYLQLSLRAISIKIQPFGRTSNPSYDVLTVIAKPYSNPIQYGLNYGHEVSYTYYQNGSVSGYASISNWIGSSTALARLVNAGIEHDAPTDLHERIYHASNNFAGIHIFPNRDGTTYKNTRYICQWDYDEFLGDDIEIYFGFAPECDTESPTKTPTTPQPTYPTKYPTISPTNNPSMNPTFNPIFNPTLLPTTNPTLQPAFIKLPTTPPTTYPTKYSTTSPTNNPSIDPIKYSNQNVNVPHSTQKQLLISSASPYMEETAESGTFANTYEVVGTLTTMVCLCIIVIMFFLSISKLRNKTQDVNMVSTSKAIEM